MIKTADGKFLVGSLPPRTVFSYGGVNGVALGYKGASVLCLAEKVLFDKAFDNDNCNNWKYSSLREHLNNDFLEELTENGAESDDFLAMVTDLTTDDGLKDYGTCEDLISLIYCQQLRKYGGVIPIVDDFWWTCTAYSTEANGYSHDIRLVYPDGALSSDDACIGCGGVRPLCKLKPNTLVTIVEEEKE
ncbi:MAG: mucin-5AC [Oscillospiraceae bacterium]